MADFLRRFLVWAGHFGVPARGTTPISRFLGGRAGMVDFLRRFLAWADDFGVPGRGPPSSGFLGGRQECLISQEGS